MGNEYSKSGPLNGPKKQERIREYIEELEKSPRDEPDNKDNSQEMTKKKNNFISEASRANPEELRHAYMRSNSVEDETDVAALLINPENWEYPFENIVLEGGGNKGLAYVGAIKCFEQLGLMGQIKRIGGTSAGAITAALIAFGYTSNEILEFLSADIEEIFMDHSCGYFSLLPNLLRQFGWNPGNKIHEWFGKAIEDKTGNPDSTFLDLYKSSGRELCIVVTNLSLMTAQYCHPKTTPNMPVRDALRMTMAIPGVFSAIHYDNHGQTDIFVDGGVLANYPINCFDGWYLSMDKKDAFLTKLKSLEELPTLISGNNRFKATGPNKTIGFLLFADSEREIMRFGLERRFGTLLPEKPREETALWLKKEQVKKDKYEAQRSHSRIVNAVDNFLSVLQKHNIHDQEFISKDELKIALEDDEFKENNRVLLFGTDYSLDYDFQILDRDGNNQIAFYELINFIEEKGIRMQVRFQGYSRREVKNFPDFLMALQDTLLTNLKFNTVVEEDETRTVGINTGHIDTMDYKLKEADREFIVERGFNATMSFLRYYAVRNPTIVKKREVPALVQNKQPNSIHSNSVMLETDSDIDDENDVLLQENKDAST